jgi:hypothetical protein
MRPPPDIVFLAPEWRPRALIRAQLIEEGFQVVATNTWPMMRRYLRPGMKPRLALVDLQGLPRPADVLNHFLVLVKPERVLVLTAMGTLSVADVENRGFRTISRPIAIADIVQAVANMVGSETHQEPSRRTDVRM